MTVTVYGIPNCDTVRKARKWLGANGIDYDFVDYKQRGVEPARLTQWAAAAGWERLLNRAGTTFRKLAPADREPLDESRALSLMAAQPSMIRRPVVEHPSGLLIGFDDAAWKHALT